MLGTIGALAASALVLAACSSGGDGVATTTSSKGTAGVTTTSASSAGRPEVESFEGSVDEFYEVPEDLPMGEPGDLIRTMPVEPSAGRTGLRIMYHSTDAEGEDRAATGLIFYPEGDAPDGGWPVLAWTHGTTGLASACAPSRHGSAPPDYGVEGVLVAPDYIGLGPLGEVHPYLSAAAEGNATIDAVKVARSIPAAHAGDDWVVAGVSQGGHAALVTNERAADRFPEANLLGAVAMAPGAELGSDFGDDIQIKVITTMVLVGVAAEDPDVDLADYLGPDALAASPAIAEGCVRDIAETMAGPAADPAYFSQDPRTSPVGRAWLEQNDPGQVAGAPLLLVQGEQDTLVVPARTDALFDRLCRIGQVTERLDVPAADHDTVVDRSMEQVTDWVQARFAGERPADDC
jgi:pimeloyl-ACP methyl ester carboxylesterase